MDTTTELTDLLVRFSKAVEAGDGNALADLFTEDGIYDDYFFGPSAPGRAGICEMLAHFYEGGEDFRWEFFAPLASAELAYASYRFSYTSKLPEAKGARVVFEGISRFTMRAGRIARYSEVFDRGMALAQQNFAPERLSRIAGKYARNLKEQTTSAAHTKAR